MNGLYFRVGTEVSHQGLWYTPAGEFTGHIHSRFEWMAAATLQMPFDQELVGWISATTTLAELFAWFTEEEIKRLQALGYYIYVYEATQVKFYEPYKHWVIEQSTSRVIGKLELT